MEGFAGGSGQGTGTREGEEAARASGDRARPRERRPAEGRAERGDPALLPLAVAAGVALAVGSLVGVAEGRLQGLLPLDAVPEAGVRLDWSARAVEAVVLQREALDGLLGTVAVLLLGAYGVALVTGATLLASRGAGLRREMAVRGALGASPGALARLLGRRWTLPLLARALPAGVLLGVAAALALRLSWPHRGAAAEGVAGAAGAPLAALLVLCALAVAAGLTLLPARKGSGGLTATLAAGQRATAGRAEGGLRRILATLQLTVCLVLLAGAALLLRDAGGGPSATDAPAEALLVTVSTPGGVDDEERGRRYRELLERVGRISTFRAESIASPGAWVDLGKVDFVLADCGGCSRGGLPLPFFGERARHHVVSPGFFDAAGVSLLSGRLLDERDGAGAPAVAVVSRSFARANFENGDPVGRHLRVGSAPGGWHVVVGVVEDGRAGALGRRAGRQPALYLSALQHPPARVELAVLGGGGGAAVSLLAAVEGAGLLAEGAGTTGEALRVRHAGPLAWAGGAATVAGVSALLLALVGVARAARLEVAGRRRELAVRAALGATPARLRWLVAWRALALALVGTVLALPLAVAVAGRLRELGGALPLFDPVAFAALAGALAVAAAFGSLRAGGEAAALRPAEALAGE